MRPILLATIALIWATSALSQSVTPRPGWEVLETGKSYEQLIDDVKAAVKAAGMGVVTQAGPTQAAKSRGVEIPGNRVIGVFNNVYAVKMLEMSVAAMIEAPVRIYVTEEADGTATLSYKTPTLVFAPYVDEGGEGVAQLAMELDAIFATIAAEAAR